MSLADSRGSVQRTAHEMLRPSTHTNAVQRTLTQLNTCKKNEIKTAVMTDSKIIEINGIFLGAAVSLRDQRGWLVVAADARVAPAEGQISATYQDASALARQAYWATAPKAA